MPSWRDGQVNSTAWWRHLGEGHVARSVTELRWQPRGKSVEAREQKSQPRNQMGRDGVRVLQAGTPGPSEPGTGRVSLSTPETPQSLWPLTCSSRVSSGLIQNQPARQNRH